MISQGPRCVDVTFSAKTVNWLHIIPVDASGNNGLREVEIWTTTGLQYAQYTCVNHVTIPQAIPQTTTLPGRLTPFFLVAEFPDTSFPRETPLGNDTV